MSSSKSFMGRWTGENASEHRGGRCPSLYASFAICFAISSIKTSKRAARKLCVGEYVSKWVGKWVKYFMKAQIPQGN